MGKGTKVKTNMIHIEIIVESEMVTKEKRMDIEKIEIGTFHLAKEM